MLQINTGKLFLRDVGRTNELTGVLYSNARLPHERKVVTEAGTIRSTGFGPEEMAIVYDLEERIETTADGPGALISHTVGPYLDDFCIVASFGLHAVFSRDPSIVRTLTDGRPGFGSKSSTSNFVNRFFDQTRYLTDEEVSAFEAFVTDLLALKRKHFLGAMDSMRTFIGGLHRISDNLGQAYTMMVSSVEPLAQGFDGFEPQWSDIPEQKRNPIDEALAEADAELAEKVRGAILGQEHVSLGQRYRKFAMDHLGDDFITTDRDVGRSVASYELEPAIAKAYQLRSSYIHRLKSLPTSISHPHAHWESTEIERVPALTFQGLYNVTHAVISSFIKRSPKIDREEYDYVLERAGIISAQMAPQYWIWKPIKNSGEGRRRLEGLLSLVIEVFQKPKEKQLVDMRSALKDAEQLLPRAKQGHRAALIGLHFLFNLLLQKDQRSEGFDEFFENNRDEANQPSVETLVIGTVLGATDDWDTEIYEQSLAEYFEQRVRKSGLHAPRLIEAAMCLSLAEKYRRVDDLEKVNAQVLRASVVAPDNEEIKALADISSLGKIDWRAILLGSDETSDDDKGAEDCSGAST